MSLDIISTQFSVVGAAQEGAMRTSQPANPAKMRTLRRCEATRNAQAIKPNRFDSRSAAASAPGHSGTPESPRLRVSIPKAERCAICGSHVASIKSAFFAALEPACAPPVTLEFRCQGHHGGCWPTLAALFESRCNLEVPRPFTPTLPGVIFDHF